MKATIITSLIVLCFLTSFPRLYAYDFSCISQNNTETEDSIHPSFVDFKPGFRIGAHLFDDMTEATSGILFMGVYLKNSNLLALTPRINLGYMPDFTFGHGRYDLFLIDAGFSAGINSRYGAIGLTLLRSFFVPSFNAREGASRPSPDIGFSPSLYIGTGRIINRLELLFELGGFVNQEYETFLRTGLSLNYTFHPSRSKKVPWLL